MSAQIEGGEAVIDTINSNITFAPYYLDKINNLRPKLTAAEITTYQHKPRMGLTRITDPRGITTHYEYDTKTIKKNQQAGK